MQIAPLLFPPPFTDVNFFDAGKHPGVKGLVALTLDDCFCRQDDPSKSLMAPLRSLFQRFDARVTFFTTLVYATGPWREKEIKGFVQDGHELANHCKHDEEYDRKPVSQFEADLDETNAWVQRMTGRDHTPWFRAPSGHISAGMSSVLKARGMKHAMLDSYGEDPHVPDAHFIARNMLRSARDGSILIIHMPEIGFRQWDLEAIKLVLEGLQSRGLRSVTLSELEAAAMQKQR